MADVSLIDSALVLDPKPDPGPFEISVSAVAEADRPALKAQIHATENAAVTKWTTADGVTISIVSGPRYDADRRFVEVEIAAVDAKGNQLLVDNPYQFANPPLKVPDGTYRKIPSFVTGAPDLVVANTREDVQAAFQIMVTQAVMYVAAANSGKP